MVHVLVQTNAHVKLGGVNFQTVQNLNATHWATACLMVHVMVQTLAHVRLDGMLQIANIKIATY